MDDLPQLSFTQSPCPRREAPGHLLARLRRGNRVAAALCAVALLTGCQSPQPAPPPSANTGRLLGTGATTEGPSEIDVETVPARDDIFQITQFWPQVIWLKNVNREPVGFHCPIYFVSTGTGKGAFVSGNVLCKLSVVKRGPDGRPTNELVHEWRLDPQQAMKFRVRRKPAMGFAYDLYLTWPSQLNLYGRDVEIQFFYERLDGRTINGTLKRFRVE